MKTDRLTLNLLITIGNNLVMKQIILFIFFSIFLGTVTAQGDILKNLDGVGKKVKPAQNAPSVEYQFEFTDYGTEEELKNISSEDISKHYLGEDIAKKFHLIQTLYTYQTAIGPGNPGTRTVIQKPLIYSALYKLDKYFKKSLKKGIYSEERASEILNHSLNIAIAAFSQNSEEFESVLKNTKNPEELTKVFVSSKLIRL